MKLNYLLIGAAISIGTALISLIDKWKKKGSANFLKENVIACLLFFFGALGVCMTYSSGIESKKEKVLSDSAIAKKERQYQKANEDLKETQKQLIALSLHQMDTSKIILLYSQNLNTKQNDLINKQDQFQKDVFGQGYCVANFDGSDDSKAFSLQIRNTSQKYSVNQIRFLITDYADLLKCKHYYSNDSLFIERDCYFKCTEQANFEELTAGAVTYIDYNILKNISDSNKLFEFKISTKSGFYLQQSLIHFQKGRCPQSYRLYKKINKEWKVIQTTNELNLKFDFDKYFFRRKDGLLINKFYQVLVAFCEGVFLKISFFTFLLFNFPFG